MSYFRIVRRQEYEKGDGFECHMAGLLGAIMTTLPSFIVIPLWAIFNYQFKILIDGKESPLFCGTLCFVLGLIVVMIAIGVTS